MTTIYWACLEKEWFAAEEPEPIAKRFSSWYNPEIVSGTTSVLGCPAIRSTIKNVFALKSIYDYELKIDGDTVTASKYGQDFYDQHVEIRSIKNKFISFSNEFIFFTDEPSLEVTFYEYPFMEDNGVTDCCFSIPGTYDIGKWFRNTEFPFFLRPSKDTFSIKNGDVYSYMRVHTNDNISFKQFRWNDKLDELRLDGVFINGHNEKSRVLNDYYSMFKNKKIIIKEITSNLIL